MFGALTKIIRKVFPSNELGDYKMVNLIALIMIALGVLMLLFGILLLVRRKKIAGTVIFLLGLGLGVIPLLVSFYLSN